MPIAGDCKPQDETLDVEWVNTNSEILDTFINQMSNGYGTIVRQAIAWAGREPTGLWLTSKTVGRGRQESAWQLANAGSVSDRYIGNIGERNGVRR